MSSFVPQNVAPAHDVLNSWKEIACYLNRGVRTVQRWEAELGMPVRRPRGKSRSAVIAMRSEIDQWLKACPVHEREQAARDAAVVPQRPLGELILSSRNLRHSMDLRREEFHGALRRLLGTLETMAKAAGPRAA